MKLSLVLIGCLASDPSRLDLHRGSSRILAGALNRNDNLKLEINNNHDVEWGSGDGLVVVGNPLAR